MRTISSSVTPELVLEPLAGGFFVREHFLKLEQRDAFAVGFSRPGMCFVLNFYILHEPTIRVNINI